MVEGRAPRNNARPAFVLVVVSFLLSTAVCLVSLHIMGLRNVREMNKVLTTQIYDYINAELSGPIMAARTMAANTFLADALMQEEASDATEFGQTMARYLAGVERRLSFQNAFAISRSSGNYYTAEGLTRKVDPVAHGDDAWYVSFVEDDASFELDVDSDEQKRDELTVYVNAKILGEDSRLLGICGVGVRMTGMQDLFRTFEEGFGVKIDLVDSRGVAQVDTNRANIKTLDLSGLIDADKSGDYLYHELDGGAFAITKYIDGLDWHLIVRSDGASDASQFASIIAINSGLCAFVLVVLILALRINQHRTMELRNASLIDQPTGLANRRAFEQEKEQLERGKRTSDLVCMTADVNGLKTVNDTIGHDAGDELIRGAADCLRTCLTSYGQVYRTGGDEFAALLRMGPEELGSVRTQLDETIRAWKGKKVSSLSVSFGFASALEFPQETVEDLCKFSDRRMYDSKERYYARTGKERRRT